MIPRVVERVDLTALSAFLGPPAEVAPKRATQLRAFGGMAICQWCVVNGVYQLPTTTLIAWLRTEIGGRRAIEIGAGFGVVGRALNIVRTDDGSQTTPERRELYRAAGQAITEPPPDVERLEACEAVAKYKPEVVIGCWVTQMFDESRGDVDGEAQALAGGIDEEWILDQPYVKKYILVGSMGSHGRKRIMKRPHREKRAPWLVSRAFDPSGNRIWVWEK